MIIMTKMMIYLQKRGEAKIDVGGEVDAVIGNKGGTLRREDRRRKLLGEEGVPVDMTTKGEVGEVGRGGDAAIGAADEETPEGGVEIGVPGPTVDEEGAFFFVVVAEAEDGGPFLAERSPLEGSDMPNEFVDEDPEGPIIDGGGNDVVRAKAFRGEVFGSSDDGVLDAGSSFSREAEVRYFQMSVGCDEDVFGLDVAMDDAVFVKMVEARNDFTHKDLINRTCQFRQRSPGIVRHDHLVPLKRQNFTEEDVLEATGFPLHLW